MVLPSTPPCTATTTLAMLNSFACRHPPESRRAQTQQHHTERAAFGKSTRNIVNVCCTVQYTRGTNVQNASYQR
eukprot:554348-Pyramimonas_sp.AAC.1